MKQILYTLILAGLGISAAVGQTQTENYIKTTEPQYATTSPSGGGLIINNNKLEKVVYYDGLGRPKQEVLVGIGPNNKNVIKHIEYDLNIGQTKDYLPYVVDYNPDTGAGYGGITQVGTNKNYVSNAKSQTETFYNSTKYGNTANPYSETVFEKSPLKRVLKQGAPGEDWKIGTGNTAHNVNYGYTFNAANQVKKLKATATWNAAMKYYNISLADEGYYPKNTLYVTTVTDENGNKTAEFTDQEGRVLLKRVEIALEAALPGIPLGTNGAESAPSGSEMINSELEGKSLSEVLDNAEEIGGNIADNAEQSANGLLDPPFGGGDLYPVLRNYSYTYYVYDQYNNLTYILPPLAQGKTDAATLDKLCYQYKYDHKNRVAAKKLPGREWEYRVYDKADRLVASGPVYSPFGDGGKGWLYSKYDAFGRVVYSGYYNGTAATDAGRKTLQDAVDAQTSWFEKKTSATAIDQVQVPYSNTTFPTTAIKILSVNYYDDYTFPGAPTTFDDIESQEVLTNAKGLATGSWTRVITTAAEAKGFTSYVLYDYKERALRSYAGNILGGYTQTDTKYNFRGLPTKTVTTHKYNNTAVVKTITETYAYDQAERLTYQTHKIDNLDEVVVFQNVYDELGRVKRKRVGGKLGYSAMEPIPMALDFPLLGKTPQRSTFLQEINYTYNIRGWLTGVNDVANLEAGDFGKKALFAMKLNYNTLDSEGLPNIKRLYNGNIAEQSWRTANDNILRRYSYGYDYQSRLRRGIYQQPGGINPVTGTYNEEMTYDLNGNIQRLNRKGQNVNSAIALDLDILAYTYDGNLLQKVTDASNNTDGFKQGSTAATHYTYDTFGNLKTDKNKGITGIKYNHLNLPVEIAFGTNKITYLYDAGGVKVQKKVTQGSNTVTTDYLDGFQYVNGSLSFLSTAEGFFDAETNNYVYQHRDHLGNVRLSYTDTNKNDKIDTGEIVEELNYYPFGLPHSGYNEKNNTLAKNYKYQYNGKELQDELGLNINDYGTRGYMPDLGRWFTVDPLAEDAPAWSPYNAMWNNPIRFVDPDGRWAVDHIDVTKNDDGTYKVVGGQANSDKNIYVVDGSGKRTGEVVGQMLTEYSFHHEDGSAVKGTNINLNDQSGQNFFNNEIKNIGLVDYISNAKGKEPLDFKHRGMPKGATPEEQGQHHYRGMSFNGKVASARDIGNYAAGYVAGKHGFGWGSSRFAFDALQTKQEKGTLNTVLWYPLNRVREGQPTQRAERAGHNTGHSIFKQRQFEREWQRATIPLPIGPKW